MQVGGAAARALCPHPRPRLSRLWLTAVEEDLNFSLFQPGRMQLLTNRESWPTVTVVGTKIGSTLEWYATKKEKSLSHAFVSHFVNAHVGQLIQPVISGLTASFRAHVNIVSLLTYLTTVLVRLRSILCVTCGTCRCIGCTTRRWAVRLDAER